MTERPTRPAFTSRLKVVPDLFSPLPVCWVSLDGQELEERREELADWVAWLRDRYGLDHRTVPDCWLQHGALLEELSALHIAWVAAFSIDARGDDPLRWHQDFAAARQRLGDWISRSGCRPSEHRNASLRQRG